MRNRATAPLRALPGCALGILALVSLPAHVLAQGQPYDSQDPKKGAGAPEQRWGPMDTPDRSPEDDSDAWTKQGPKPPPPSAAPSSSAGPRRRYSYEEDPRPSERAAPARRQPPPDRERKEDPDADFPRFGFEAFFLDASYDGRVQSERDGAGTKFKPEHGYDLDSVEPALSARIVFAPTHDWTLEFEYTLAYFSGRDPLEGDLEFDGRFFPQGNDVEVAVQDELMAFTAEYTFFAREHFRMGLPFGFAWLSQKTRVKDYDSGIKAEDRVDALTPFLGLAVDVPFGGGVGIDARFRTFGYDIGDSRDRIAFAFFDFETRFYVTVFNAVRLYAGYRYLGVANQQRDNYDDSRGDFQLNCFIAGAGVTF